MTKLVLIDGSNLFHESRKNNVRIDFTRLRQYLESDGSKTLIRFYAGVPSDLPYKQQSFLDNLSRMGIRVRRFTLRNVGESKVEKGVDVALATDMVFSALQGHVAEVVLVSGDADYNPAIECVSNVGIPVTGLFWERSTSTEFRHSCDRFVALEQIAGEVCM